MAGSDEAYVEAEEEQFQEYRQWRLGPIFAERLFHGYDKPQKAHISEASATCLATQVEGPNLGLKAILKIRKQVPTDVESPEDIEAKDLARTKPCKYGIWASYEFYNLKRLSRLGCSCTPKLLGHKLVSQSQDDYVPGGFVLYLLMEKVPGRNLVNFPSLPMPERDQVRLAFAKAIREFYSLRYRHDDANRRNLIWDPKGKKCYIIDLEDAYEINDDAKPARFKPSIDWLDWGLAGQILISDEGVDPMVPCHQYSLVDPGHEALLKMATDAVGKEIYNPYAKEPQ